MWAVTLIFLGLGLLGPAWSYGLVALVSAFQVVYFIRKTGNWSEFETQVRWAYLGLAVFGLLDPTRLLFLLMFLTTAMVVFFDQRLVEMILRRMPWNKKITGGS